MSASLTRNVGISFEGDEALANKLIPAARQELGILLDRLASTGLETGAKHYAVPLGRVSPDSEGHVYIKVLSNIARIHIVVDESKASPEEVTTKLERKYQYALPDFLSGFGINSEMYEGVHQVRMPNGVLEKVEVDYFRSFLPTALCSKQQGFEADQKIDVLRLAVAPNVMWDFEFSYEPEHPGSPYTWPEVTIEEYAAQGGPLDGFPSGSIKPDTPLLWSQAKLLRPTWWTGAMRQCVQYLLGVGFPTSMPWYGPILGLVTQQDVAYKSGFSSDYLVKLAANGLQIRYDYRSIKTDGIIFGADTEDGLKTPYLVQISLDRGIIMARLPMFPGTDTKEFNAFMKDVDLGEGRIATDILKVIDTFGGMPSGEPIPLNSTDYNALVRAGIILEVRDPLDIDGTAFSSSLGWAFSDSGKKAANCFYRYDEDGVQTSEAWEIDLTVTNGEPRTLLENNAMLSLSEALEDEAGKKAWEELTAVQRFACKAKAPYIPPIAAAYAQVISTLDSAELEPVFTGTAAPKMLRKGRLASLYASAGDEIKVPEPILGVGVVISHEMLPEIHGQSLAASVEQDSPVFVCYHGEELKWIRKFKTHKDGPESTTEGETPSCFVNTSWTITSKANGKVHPEYYTDDYDDRGDEYSYSSEGNFVSGAPQFAGWSGVADLLTNGRYAFRIYNTVTTRTWKREVDRAPHAYCVIPTFDRAAYVMNYVLSSGASSSGTDTSVSQYADNHIVADTQTTVGAKYSCCKNFGDGKSCYHGTEAVGLVYFSDPTCVTGHVPPASYGQCGAMPPWSFSGQPLPGLSEPTEEKSDKRKITKAEIRIRYAQDGKSVEKIHQADTGYVGVDGEPDIDPWWYTPSPNEYGDYARYYLYGNTLGDATIVAYNEDFGHAIKNHGKPELDDKDFDWTPMGVINA